MADLREIALGITATLGSRTCPNPLSIKLWGESDVQAATLIKAIIDECVDANLPLLTIRSSSAIVRRFTGPSGGDGSGYRGVAVLSDQACDRELSLRWSQTDTR